MPDPAARGQQGCSSVPQVVERGPPHSLRYLRYDTVLGKGAFKTVYKGFDDREGIEVAWNQVKSQDFIKEGQKLTQEISVLKNMKHGNVMCFYDSWIDKDSGTVNFITELFTSGTLRQYRQKHKNLGKYALKRWAWQILQGLVYLHGHNPPIIHRDLKCDNIFVNGSAGVVKIGDLGLATLLSGATVPQSCTGTPEFMAPELYDECYDEKVDVYGFGMCMLELATMQYPYSECVNAAQIYKRVSQGRLPEGLSNVEDVELRDFIVLCISHAPGRRPDARKLLKHSFFADIRKSAEKEREMEKIVESGHSAPARDLSPTGSASSPKVPSPTHSVESESGATPLPSVPGRSSLGTNYRQGVEEVAPMLPRSAPGGAQSTTDSPMYSYHRGHGPYSQSGAHPLSSVHGAAAASYPPHNNISESVRAPNMSFDRVFVRAVPCENMSDGQMGANRVVSMEVGNLPQQDGETCNIEFKFEIGLDNVQDIIDEMQSELNLNLSKDEALLIHHRIDEELRKCDAAPIYTWAQQIGVMQSFQFAPVPVIAGNNMEEKSVGVHFFQDSRRSAFESSQGGLSTVCWGSQETEAGTCFGDVASSNRAASNTPAQSHNGNGVLGPKNGVGSCKLSHSPSLLEPRELVASDQAAAFKRVEFSELQRRFEEAHASGILHDTRA